MNYLKSIKSFQKVASIVEQGIRRIKSSDTQKQTQKVEKVQSEKSEKSESQNEENQVEYAQAQSFLLELRSFSAQREQSENALKRKIALFQRVEIEPHYLSPADNKKLLQFQFHLGSDIFVERVEHLIKQNEQMTAVIEQVISKRKQDAFNYLQRIGLLSSQVDNFISDIANFRANSLNILNHKVYRIWVIIKRKNIIIQKIKLLKKMKEKNQMAFIDITNIDQAFATEQLRDKLYDKIKKLTGLEKSNYICNVKNKLISTAKTVVRLVEDSILKWVEDNLPDKQIEKVVVLVYYIQQKSVYLQNNLVLDLKKYDKKKLKQNISKIFQWQSFNYVKNMVTRQKINQFLNIFLKKIQ